MSQETLGRSLRNSAQEGVALKTRFSLPEKPDVYDYAFVTTETEAEEILHDARAFSELVERWIKKKYPSLL